MSAVTDTNTSPKEQQPTVTKPNHVPVRPVSLARVIRSEWIKLWTLRSTIWIIVITLAAMVGMSALMATGMTFDPGAAGDPQGGNPQGATVEVGEPMGLSSMGLMVVTFGYFLGQIVVVVLGVMAATGEYATGQIRATLSAVPTRTPVLLAKIITVTLVSFGLGALAVALAWLTTYPILEPHGMLLDLSDDGAWRSLFGVPLYLSAIGLFSLGVGFLLRHTAGAISAVLGILLVLPMMAAIPLDWLRDLLVYLPGAAGERLILNPNDLLTEWQGFAVLCAYVLAVLLAAGIVLRRRDA